MKNGKNGDKRDKLQEKEMWAILVDSGSIGNLYLYPQKGHIRKKWVVRYADISSLRPLIERKFEGKKYQEARDYFQNLAHRFHFVIIDRDGGKAVTEQIFDEVTKGRNDKGSQMD